MEIKGKIKKGRGLGKTMGFPTINIPYDGEVFGVFAGEVFIDGKSYIAAIHVGKRPTVHDDRLICEAFLLNFTGEINDGTEVKVQLGEKIRDIKKFDSLEDLKAQIAKDVEFIKLCYNL